MSTQITIKNESLDKGHVVYVEASEFSESPGFELAGGESRLVTVSPGIQWTIREVQP